MEDLIKKALEVADNSFYEEMDNAPLTSKSRIVRAVKGIAFEFRGKKYNIDWAGFWESSQNYKYHITGNGVDVKGFREL